jgi:hypothetical protein
MQPPDIVNLLAVPVAFSRHSTAATLNPSLREHLLSLERSGVSANPRFGQHCFQLLVLAAVCGAGRVRSICQSYQSA